MAGDNTKVLVVDDQSSIRLTLSAILEKWGYDVVGVEDGYRAIDAARAQPFDLILMDIKMPGINGVQTFREIKRIRPGSLVVMMTGYAVEDLVEAAQQEGAFSVIYKPFDMEELLKLVDSISKSILVMVVDDHSLERESLSEILTSHGYKVTNAADGDEAIELFRGGSFDVILMDLKLPGRDGFATFQIMKQIDPGTDVVFITGIELEDTIKKAAEEGGYPILHKPLDIHNLLTLVKRIGVVKSR